MKYTLPDSSSPRRDPLGSQDSYIVITPQIPNSTALVWIWLPCCLWACRTLGPPLIKPSHQLSGLPCIHCVSPPAFSTCSRIVFKIQKSTPNPYFPKFIFIIEMKELNLHGGMEVSEVHGTKKVNIHTAIMSYHEASYKIHGPMQTLKHAITSCYTSCSCAYSVLLRWSPFPFR